MMYQMDYYIWDMSSKFICISSFKFSVYFSIITCFFWMNCYDWVLDWFGFFIFIYILFLNGFSIGFCFELILFWVDFEFGLGWVWVDIGLISIDFG